MTDRPHDHGRAGAGRASDPNALRAEALESILVERGLVRSELVDAIIRRFEQDIGPMNGAKAVARAWSDPGYRARLLADPWPAIAELGVTAIPDAPLVVVQNSATVHNVVVCTLCSCYPS